MRRQQYIILIVTRKFEICFRRSGCRVDDQIRVGPCALLEAANVIAQNVEIGAGGRGGGPKLRIEGLCRCEQVDRKTGKDYAGSFHLRGETGKLIDLFRAKVGLYIPPEVIHQFRDSRYDGRTQQFLAHRAHDDILILGAAECGVLADARHP